MSVNQTPYIHENVICANIFVRKGDKYLLLKRSALKKFAPNFVHPIGGKVDQDEDPFTGAQRELLEEAGVKVKNMKLEAVILEVIPHKELPYNWLIFHFSADYDSGEVLKTEEGELLWLAEEEILEQELFPSVRKLIKSILNPKEGTVFARFEYDDKGEIIEENNQIN